MLGIAIAAALLVALFSIVPTAVIGQQKGPMADQVTWLQIPDEAIALNDLEAGGHDVRIDSVRSVEAQTQALTSPNLKTFRAFSSFWNLKVNPVARTDGKFNPMTVREVREALNWLFDRSFIAEEIYGGLGTPHIVLFNPGDPDYGRFAGFIAGVEARYPYDPAKAEAVISQAMLGAGATVVGGKWYHGGEPVVITFIIRTTPAPRTNNGNYMAGIMEELGFTVNRQYMTGGQVSPIVYSGDPRAGLWTMYTEGWGSTGLTLWSVFRGYQMFQWPAFSTVWNYHSVDPRTNKAITDWFTSNFTSEQERAELVKIAIEGTIKDSTRVWLVVEESMYVSRADTPLVGGLGGGYNELYTVRSASKNGQVGGNIKVSQFDGFVGGWNPIGITWLFDRNIEYSYRDPGGVWAHPHTGKFIPLRATFNIETNGTDGSVAMPSDAIRWNMTSKAWEQVGANKTVLSKVTYTYNMGKWHHGQAITTQDILAGIAATYRLENPAGDAYCACHAGQFTTFQLIFRGVKVVSANQVDVYVDYWHWDDTMIAAFADVWTSTPWEVWEVMLKSYADGDGVAFLEEDAEAKDWEWMNLAFGDSVPILKANFDGLKAANTIPMSLTGRVTAAEATARYNALDTWYTAHSAAGNAFLVSNGPFYIDSVDIPTETVVVKADRANYPLDAGIWSGLTVVKKPDVSFKTVPQVTQGVPATFEIGISVAGTPYDDATVTYIVLDPASAAIITEGTAVRVSAGTFEARMSAFETGVLSPGSYEMRVVAVGAEAAPPTIARTSFFALPVASYLESLIKNTEAALRTELGSLGNQIGDVGDSTASLARDVAGLSTLLTVVLVLAVVAIGTSVVTVLVIIRRMPPPSA